MSFYVANYIGTKIRLSIKYPGNFTSHQSRVLYMTLKRKNFFKDTKFKPKSFYFVILTVRLRLI